YVRTRRLRSSTEVVTDVVPERPAAGCLEDQAADQAELWAALGALSERQRAVLVLRYYEGLADHEIGALLGCREASVRSLARRRPRAGPSRRCGCPARRVMPIGPHGCLPNRPASTGARAWYRNSRLRRR